MTFQSHRVMVDNGISEGELQTLRGGIGQSHGQFRL